MKTVLALSCSLLLAACGQPERVGDANEAHFTQALQAYLARRGDLCVNRSAWPVEITREEAAQGSRNSMQLPVLERLGLVRSTMVAATQSRRYELTDEGRRFLLARAPYKRDTGHAVADHDFCVARLSLKHVVGWETPGSQRVGAETVVSYTYDVSAAPWTADPQVRQVFPMVDRVLRGAGTMQLKEAMVLTADGWEAKDL
jgi:DNA-binding MarR family transcriptional regulator